MGSHELPNHGQDIFLLSISDVLGTHSNHADSKGLHCLNGQVAVMVVIEHVLGHELWFTPVDSARFNAMADAQDDQTIADLLKEILNEAVLNLHGVDPETESALFTRTRDIIIDDTGSFKLLLSQLLQAVLAIENRGYKD